MAIDNNSILGSTKKALGLSLEDTVFDPELISFINGVFGTLQQLGVGPAIAYEIEGPEETWDLFLENRQNLNGVKPYMYAKVRLIFDPPATSFGIEALKGVISEYEFRLNVESETPT